MTDEIHEPEWPEAPKPTQGAVQGAVLERFKSRLGFVADRAKSHDAERLAQLEGRIAAEQALADANMAEAKARIDAGIAEEKAKSDQNRTEDLKELDADLESLASFHQALTEVAAGTIDRARTSAELVQKAATAIVGLYTPLLAIVFSVSDRPLPSRGLVPAVLLGWAIVLSTVYLAYLSRPAGIRPPEPNSDFRIAALRRTSAFILWTRSGALNRGYFLQASVVALAFGLASLPAPFLTFGTADTADVATAVEAGWPSPPADVDDAELAKILYTAQVTEAAERRAASEPAVADGSDSWWWIGCAFAALAALLAPLAINAIARARTQDCQPSQPREPDDNLMPGPMQNS